MSEAARIATHHDLPAITSILEAVAPAIAEQRGGAIYLAAEAADLQPLADAIDDADATVVVGTYDNVILGAASMRFVVLADGQVIGRIERLVVDEEARKSGIGEAMMNRLLEACNARSCDGIEAIALPGDRHTKNFFESFGLKARMLTVMKRL